MINKQIFNNFIPNATRWVLLLLLIVPITVWSQSGVELQPTPDGGIHPRMFQDRNGDVHLLYFRKRSSSPRASEGDLFYRQYDGASRDWGSPVRVSSQSFNSRDPIYRANFDIDDEGRIHVIWYQARPDQYFYTRSSPERAEFELQRSMVSDNLAGVDAGADIAVEGSNVAIVWAAGVLTKEEERTVYARTSSDYGETFSAEAELGNKALGACACCSLAVEYGQQQKILVAYRSAIEGVGRHMQLLSVDAPGVDSGIYADLYSLQQWELTSCPVSTNDFSEDYQQNDWLVFESESRIVQINTTAGSAPERVAEPLTRTRQKHPSIAFSSDGYKLIAWAEGISFTKGGILNWQLFDEKGELVETDVKQQITIPNFSSPAVVVTPAGSFLILY